MNNDFTGMFSRNSGTVSQGDLTGQEGIIESLGSMDITINDDELLQNLKTRVETAKSDWDDSTDDGYNLSEKRRLNKLYFDGYQIQNKLKAAQIPYSENQIWVGWSAVLAYLTNRIAQPNVYPSSDSDTAKRFGVFFEKVLDAHNDKFEFRDIAAKVVNDSGLSYIGCVKLEFDPDEGEDGDIVPKLIDPQNLTVDNHTPYGGNPRLLDYKSPMTASEMIHRWPNKKEKILELASVSTENGKPDLDVLLILGESWFTYYDSKFEPQEGVIYYCDDCILEKSKNPNFSYVDDSLNIIKTPPKPFIFCNISSDGRLLIDKTNPVEQGRIMQDFLNLAGRHSLESSLRSNPTIVVNGDTLTEDDAVSADKLATKAVITLTNVPQGSNTEQQFGVVPASVVSPELLAQKQDLRTQTLAMIGAPDVLTGAGDNGDTSPTLGQSEIKKDQAQGRLDLMTRSIDKFYTDYYRLLAHMMSVWFIKRHSFTSSSNSGYKRIFISRGMIDTKVEIHVEGGSTLPINKAEQQAIAENLLDNKAIALLDYYKISGIENPQELYDNYIQFTQDPTSLARKESSENYEFTAQQILERFEDEPEVEISESSDGFIKAMRDLTVSPEFLDTSKTSKKAQKRFNDYMQKVIIENLKRKIVANAAKQGVMALEPDLKFTPVQIGTVVQAEGAGVPGGASDPTIPGAAQAAQQVGLNPDGTPMSPQSQTPSTPAQAPPATTYKNAQGQLVTPNGQTIDPNHFYSIQELAAMGLSPQNLQEEAGRAQQQIQQTGVPQQPQQPQQPMQPQPQAPQVPQPSQMPQQPVPQLTQ
jgi:hypothetical protein